MDTIEEFIKGVSYNSFIQATLSKPRPFSPYKQIIIRPVQIQGVKKYQVTFRTDTKDQVNNFDWEMLDYQIHMWLVQYFFYADLITKKENIRLMQSKKGQLTIKRTKANNHAKSIAHDKKKNRKIPEDAPYLRELGLSSTKGKIYQPAQKKYKQINQYIELVTPLMEGRDIQNVVDMGSGKGYLTFALYDRLHQSNEKINVEGIEIRDDLVKECNTIAQKVGFDGLKFRKGNIDKTDLELTDMVIALHACDIATDMAIAKGIQAKAKVIVVSPCCHKQIRKEIYMPNHSTLRPLVKYGIFKERMAEMITDTIRTLILESKGYKTKVMEFVPLDHTPKNILITAEYTGKKDPQARREIDALKKEFGIQSHYLETLIDQ